MNKSSRFFIGLGSALVLASAWFITSAVMGAEAGEPCDPEWGCKGLESVCLEGDAPLCSVHCESDDACPSGWTCNDVPVLNINGKSGEVTESSTPVCLPAQSVL